MSQQFFSIFTYNFVSFKFYKFIFWLFSSDTMFVGPTVSELRFYGCCHPCSWINCSFNNVSSSIYQRKLYICVNTSFCIDHSIQYPTLFPGKTLWKQRKNFLELKYFENSHNPCTFTSYVVLLCYGRYFIITRIKLF